MIGPKKLIRILKMTKADRILYSYLLFVLISALLILVFEPDIKTYPDALWYCYAVISTTGFGDIVVHTVFAKLISVIITIYSLIVIAIITGVFVSYYDEILKANRRETITAFLDELERLPELSPKELEDLSSRVRSFREKRRSVSNASP